MTRPHSHTKPVTCIAEEWVELTYALMWSKVCFDVDKFTTFVLTQALDDVKTRCLHPPTQFRSDRLVGYHGNDAVKLLKQLLFTNDKTFANVIAETKTMVDDCVH